MRAMARSVAAALLGAAAVLLAMAAARATTIYRWVDEQGTVHFGDAPPHDVPHYEAESLPDAPRGVARPPGNATPAAAADPGAPANTPSRAATGPAHVVLTGSKAEPVGEGVQAIRGTVKNNGGAPAHDVAIAIVVTEPVQGAECLRDVADVEPATLAAGQEGRFEVELANPCFHGPTDVALTVDWR